MRKFRKKIKFVRIKIEIGFSWGGNSILWLELEIFLDSKM